MRLDEPLEAAAVAVAAFRNPDDGPALLAALRRTDNIHSRARVANAVAAVGYRPALPVLREAAADARSASARNGAGWVARDTAEVATLAVRRLEDDWGVPGPAVRLLLIPPAPTVVGRPMEMTIYAENVGAGPVRSWNDVEIGLEINGGPARPVPAIRFVGGLTYEVLPGQVYTIRYDLSPLLTRPGRYVVRYVAAGARSAAITVEVLPEPQGF